MHKLVGYLMHRFCWNSGVELHQLKHAKCDDGENQSACLLNEILFLDSKNNSASFLTDKFGNV